MVDFKQLLTRGFVRLNTKTPVKRILAILIVVISMLVIYTQIRVFSVDSTLEKIQSLASSDKVSVALMPPNEQLPSDKLQEEFEEAAKEQKEEEQREEEQKEEEQKEENQKENKLDEEKQSEPEEESTESKEENTKDSKPLLDLDDEDISLVGNIHVEHNPNEEEKEVPEDDIYEPAKAEDEDLEPEKQPELKDLAIHERLLKVYPYSKNSDPIDKNVIQSWKTTNMGELGKNGESWLTNEGFKHTLFDDKLIEKFLQDNFNETFPEIITTFHKFPRNILRYDFFRYIATFIMGGTYTDSDTLQSKPFTEWITYQEKVLDQENTIGFAVGLEVECDCARWHGISTRRVQFCQWTIQAKKHHPLLALLVSTIVEQMEINYNEDTKIWKYNKNEYDFNKGSESYYDGIMELTGPGAFTDSIFKYANSVKDPKFINPNDQEAIMKKLRVPNPADKTWSWNDPNVVNLGWENITEITKPLLFDQDLLILPKVYFNGKKDKDELNLVQHDYQGSWKNANSNKKV